MIDHSSGDLRQILTGEVLFFSLLSRLFYSYPNDEIQQWIKSMIEEKIFSEVPYATDQEASKKGIELIKQMGMNSVTDETLEKIRDDYLRLFIGIGKVLAPPWESVYFNENHLLFREQTLQVRNWYRRYGLEYEKIHKEPDDHISLEMSFIVCLSKRALEALEENNKQKFEQLIEAQRQFLSEHLLAWGSQFCRLVIEHAETDFYRGLAYLIMGGLNALQIQFSIQPSREAVK